MKYVNLDADEEKKTDVGRDTRPGAAYRVTHTRKQIVEKLSAHAHVTNFIASRPLYKNKCATFEKSLPIGSFFYCIWPCVFA